MKSNTEYEVVIIGAGPAGMSSAIYLKRAGITPLLLEFKAPGGTLNIIHDIENYPGYTEKDGTTLAFRMYGQIEELNVPLKTDKVLKIEKQNEVFFIKTQNGEYTAKYIILATGKVPRKLDSKNADIYEGKGISYCAVCDGALYKNKDIAIIGGGNSAMEAATYMNNIANRIYIINRSEKLRADEMEKEVLKNSNIEVMFNRKVTEIKGDKNGITSIVLDDGKIVNVNAVFVCIGQEKSSVYYQDLNLNSDNKGIIVNSNMQTSCKNVFAAGDCVSKSLYQVITATSEGAIAATNIIKEIKNSK